MDPTRIDRRISFIFTAIVVAAFGGFLALGAASPATFSEGVIGIIPLSVVLAATLIVGAIALTGLYVLIANRRAR
ncbi:DUF485 domain-containing protein [Beijerinckia sp. L45]|uniref:DUF485 domain-containing protein n=1 Tax=Beijerinckia sp. L45 TaxID=1641855 RepID=UPI00131C8B97|nr:DUF485 domain-containing protein [Beijerinckia sp. L45]